jgi:uncharacterized membrane protein YsdA (DUF1294 family)
MGCNQAVRRSESKVRMMRRNISTALLFLVLLILPGYAISTFSLILFIPVVAVSIGAYFFTRFDKFRAESRARRIPETTLHLIELFGGWPGAFLAQRRFRHKSSKFSYQSTYWLIVTIHQAVALDFLLGWRLSKELLDFLRGG